MHTKLTDDIYYIGADDKTLDLFEGQYIIPNGISYNSYVIMDDKIAVMDTADKRVHKEWFDNLQSALQGRTPDYLIVLHMEPDHAANLADFMHQYPTAKIVSNTKTIKMIPQFFPEIDLTDKTVVVDENFELDLGHHTLKFIMAPMVHWPEVMMAYDTKDKVLFSADAFGKFGALDTKEDWDCEARRYYINIVGKYGAQVQNVLKKVATLDIQKIFPLHGPMLTSDLGHYLEKYDIWSSYKPETKGTFIAYASIYGNTKQAVEILAEILRNKDEKIEIADLAREDFAEAVENAFRYDKMVVASPTYDGEMFPVVEAFLNHIKAKNYQNRTVAFIENGSWAPIAAKKMRASLENCKNITFIEPVVSIMSSVKEADKTAISNLAISLVG
ncbi:MAG: FprA family A-type flavoprotein [Alphaproteobacteria bacterium]|nr:FprA family A-type flavoprotein [Alphaproteobacteria bacterium]